MGNNSVFCKARYERLKAAHICITCGKEEAFGNFVRCAKCMEKQYLSVGNDLEKQRQNLKDLRARKKAAGECYMCKQPVCDKSKIYCEKHYLTEKLRLARFRLNHSKRAY